MSRYHYFFARGKLDIAAMRDAARRLVGEHDYRNFCKLDPTVSSFVRRITAFEVRPVEPPPAVGGAGEGRAGLAAAADDDDDECSLAPWVFVIDGSAFLWHQVRCMVATLFLVGSGREAPSLVDSLLDLQQCPARPCYDMAPDAPLLLHSIGYPEARLRWTPHADESLSAVAALWRREAEAATLRSAMLLTMRSSLLSARVARPAPSDRAGDGAGGGEGGGGGGRTSLVPWGELLAEGGRSPGGEEAGAARGGKYIPVLQRPTADGVEAKAATHEAKRARREARQQAEAASGGTRD